MNNKKNYIAALNEIKVDENIKREVINNNYKKIHNKFNFKLITRVAMAAVILLFIMVLDTSKIKQPNESTESLNSNYKDSESMNYDSESAIYDVKEDEYIMPNANSSLNESTAYLNNAPTLPCGANTLSRSEKLVVKKSKKIILGAMALVVITGTVVFIVKHKAGSNAKK